MAEDAVPQDLNYRHSCRVGLRRVVWFAFYDGEGAVELFDEWRGPFYGTVFLAPFVKEDEIIVWAYVLEYQLLM